MVSRDGLLNQTNPRARWAKETVVMWLAFFLFYAATAGQDILAADSGEFQLITAKWGIAHPPGYPLYTIIGALWSHFIRLGSFPYRTNLFSAALAATSLLLSFDAVVMWALKGGISKRGARIGGLTSLLLLGSAGTFWAQATTANIRMPTLLFTAWGFAVLARYQKASSLATRDKVLCQLAFVIGLGVGHHPSLLFVVIGWVTYILLCDIALIWTPRRWLKVIAVALCAWAVPQLYLPIRDTLPDAILSPGNLASWQGFWNHALARGFSGDMFAYATQTDLALRLPLLPSLFRFQFPTLSIVLMILGWFWLLRRQPKFAIACLLSWLIHTFVTITYRAPQTIEYLMPAYIPMVLVFGVSIAAFWGLGPSLPKPKRRVIYTAIGGSVILLSLRMIVRTPDFALLAADSEIRNRTEPLLNEAPENALILADWRWVTPLWALQKIENRAPSVQISYVYPEEPKAYDQVWLDRVESAVIQPVFVTHKYDWSEWNFSPVGGGYRLFRRPLKQLPADLNYTEHQVDLGSIRLLGYRISGDIQPGQTIEFHLAWQAIQLHDPPPSFTARVWDAEGNLLAASDRFLGGDSALDEIRFTQLVLQLPLDHCSAHIQATLGVYAVASGEFVDLGTADLETLAMFCEYPALPVVRTWPGYITNQGPIVRGIDYDMQNESSGVAYLHLSGPGAPVHIQSDTAQVTVPALGIGDDHTVLVPFSHSPASLYFTRLNGMNAKYLGLPFPSPTPGERYTPYGDKMVLISSNVILQGKQTVLNLKWVTARPIAGDYVVSTRLRSSDDSWQLKHDMQPGLGAIPTLKWVTKNSRFIDPHPFVDLPSAPSRFEIIVYEPFRMTPLPSPYGEIVSYSLP